MSEKEVCVLLFMVAGIELDERQLLQKWVTISQRYRAETDFTHVHVNTTPPRPDHIFLQPRHINTILFNLTEF